MACPHLNFQCEVDRTGNRIRAKRFIRAVAFFFTSYEKKKKEVPEIVRFSLFFIYKYPAVGIRQVFFSLDPPTVFLKILTRNIILILQIDVIMCDSN